MKAGRTCNGNPLDHVRAVYTTLGNYVVYVVVVMVYSDIAVIDDWHSQHVGRDENAIVCPVK